MIGTCFENGRNVSLLSSHLSPTPLLTCLRLRKHQTRETNSSTCVIGSFMTSTSVTLPNWPKYSRSLSWLVCQLRPPTKSLPGAESEEGVERPEDSPWLPSSLVPEVGEVRGNPVSAAWSIDNLGRQRVRSWRILFFKSIEQREG